MPLGFLSETGKLLTADTVRTIIAPQLPNQEEAKMAGTISQLAGEVLVRRKNGAKFAACAGDNLYEGDMLVVLAGGSIHFTSQNKTEITIPNNSKFSIDSAAQNGNTATFTFFSGEACIGSTGIDTILTVNTPVAVLTLEGKVRAGWRIDRDSHVWNFYTNQTPDSGKLKIRTLCGMRQFYQPNIFICASSFNKVLFQMTNLENPGLTMQPGGEPGSFATSAPATGSSVKRGSGGSSRKRKQLELNH